MTVDATRAKDALGGLVEALVGTSDEKLARIVGVLDGTTGADAERDMAEALIAPLRPRLAQLRPRRRLNLSRLTFTPLDPVIVPAAQWARGEIGVPRTALAPLWTTIRAALGPREAELQTALAAAAAGRCEKGRCEKVGATLWPLAAAALSDAEPATAWQAATGLDAADHQALASRIAALLARAPGLAAMETRLAAGSPPTPAELAAWLTPLAETRPPALATGIALLLARMPQAEAVMALSEDPERVLATTKPEVVAATEAAIGFALDAAVSVPATGGDAAAEAVRQAALLLLGLEARAQERPTRLARIRAARQAADARLRAGFTEAISTHLATSSTVTRQDVAAEASALALRRFAGAARHLGSAPAYEAALRQAATALIPPRGADAPTRVARARLVEILVGSEAAAAMLGASD